jgi:hypothetical protein
MKPVHYRAVAIAAATLLILVGNGAHFSSLGGLSRDAAKEATAAAEMHKGFGGRGSVSGDTRPGLLTGPVETDCTR